MRVETKKVTPDIITKHSTLKEHPSCKNMDIITVYNEDNIELGYAIITPKQNYDMEEVFKKNFIGLLEYSNEEYNYLYSEYEDVLKESNYLNYIEVYDKNKGTGAIILNILKEVYETIWLYSSFEAENFYIKNNFVEISPDDHVYLYHTYK